MASYDYIIVGAGSAGCVLACRLSADPFVRVLLLEAGGKDRSPNIKIPAAFPKQFHTKLDWDFATEPEPSVDGRSLYVPRGKVLGGSSSMNAMLYVRGRATDYDGWAAQGAPGWSYADVLPYFIAAEDNARGASPWHGSGGPLRVAEQRSPRPLDRRLIAAGEAAGIARVSDYNGPEQDGVAMFQVTQAGGRRFSAADAYLAPIAKRPNLEVRTNTTVLGIELAGDRAVGVRVRAGHSGAEVLRAREEVILSACSSSLASATPTSSEPLASRPATPYPGSAPTFRITRSCRSSSRSPTRTPCMSPSARGRWPSGCCAGADPSPPPSPKSWRS